MMMMMTLMTFHYRRSSAILALTHVTISHQHSECSQALRKLRHKCPSIHVSVHLSVCPLLYYGAKVIHEVKDVINFHTYFLAHPCQTEVNVFALCEFVVAV